MNKNIHRVIFNAARGLWTAVEETATGTGKGRSAGTRGGRIHARSIRVRVGLVDMLSMRHVAFAAMCALGMQPLWADAQVVVAPTAGSRPAVGVTANGLPIVQIATPNGAGVSNNAYTNYNVGQSGLILNNSATNVQTQLGGYVTGNPNLAAGSARVIVNQVVGGNASQLLGYTEVAGQKAEVVIANPAGIYCNGCGFINTSRSILTTGTPVFGGTGSLDAFHVTGGQIQIGSAGLNGSNVDQVDLIARSVAVNGKIWAGQSLNVVTGNNDVRHGDLNVQSLGPDGNNPGVAIDVAQLGGMYAGKIMLVGTETGVGVNSAGTIASQAGDVQISSQGKVTLSGSTSASGNVAISAAGDVANSGSVYATQNTTLNSQDRVSNSGTVAALGNTAVTGGSVDSTGSLGAGIDANGNVTGTGSLAVTGTGSVSATGQQMAGGDLALSGSSLNMAGGQTLAKGNAFLTATGTGGDTGNIVHTGASMQAGGSLTANAAGTVTNDQGQMSAAQLGVTAGGISNRSGTLSQTGAGDTTLAASGTFDNTGGTVTTNAQNTTIRSGNLINTSGTISQAGTGALIVQTGALANDHGSIGTNGVATVAATSLRNASGSITSAQALDVASGGDIDNTAGRLEAAGAVNVSGANVQNAAGRIVSDNGDGFTLTASGQITNVAGTTAQGGLGGVIGGNGNATINAATLTNSGTVTAAQDLGVTTSAALDNSGGSMSGATLEANAASLRNANGTISANTVSVTVPQLDNSSGKITANEIDVSATNLTNQNGSLTQLGSGAMGVNVSGTLDNSNGGVIQTNSTDLTLASSTLNNDGGTITHAGTGTLTIASGNGTASLANVGGKIVTNGQASVTLDSLDNTGGTLASQGVMNASVQGTLNNMNGRLSSGTGLSASSGGELINVGGVIGAGGAAVSSTLSLSASSIDNSGGAITNVGNGDTTINGGSQIINRNAGGASGMGSISGNGNVTLNATSISNTQGGQLSGANLQINTGILDNTGGEIGNVATTAGDVGIATGTLTSTSGQINASRNLSVSANTLAGGGTYSAVNDLSLNLQGNFTTSPSYRFSAGHNLIFTLPGTFSNSGALSAANGLNLNAGDIANSGVLAAGGLLTTHSNTLTNTGTIVGGSVSLNATQSLSNLGASALIGATDSAGTLELLAPDIENRDDTTATDTQATTAIYGLGKVVLAGGKDAGGNYTNANLVRNQSALIQSGGDMTIDASQVTNTRRVMTTTGLTSAVDPALLGSLGISMSGCTAIHMEACSGQDVGWVTAGDPTLIGGAYTQPTGGGGQWNSGYQYTTYTGVAVANTIASISPQAQILAGGNLNTSSVGTLQNYWSQVAATGNIMAPATIDQNSWQGESAPMVQVTYSGEYHYNNYDNSEHNWQLPFGDAPFVGPNPGGYSQAAPADIRTYALPGYESTFTAGGTLSGTGMTINNTAGNAGVAPLGLLPGQSVSGAGAVAVQGGQIARGSLTNFNNPVIARATAVNVLSNIALPKGGLFSVDSAPNASYLIETNPAFTSQQQWLSSDYYFQQMGMNPGQIQLRLGDGFYEQKLVQDQVMSMTGQSVLTNYASTQDEYQALMTSGAALAKSLNLAPGTGLSPEQASQLTSNVVIMQTQIVDGQSVLVPVVYLAQASQQNMDNGPVIAATNIDLQNAQSVTSSGTIKAANSFSIGAQSIDGSFGTLQSGGQMTLATAGDVNLTSATVNAGSLALLAGGNLILDTAAKTLDQVSDSGATRVTTTLGPAATINVAGNAAIVTGGNFEQNAGSLNVGGSLGMSIGGDWMLGVQQTGETKVVTGENRISDTHLVSDTGSSVKVGGVSSIAVGGDLTATGANINLGGGGIVAAGGNVTLQAASATSTVDRSSSGTDNRGSYAESLHTSDDTVTGTTFKSGDSLAIVSGKDINITGSTVSLDKGNALLMAAGSVNVGVTTETHVSDSYDSGSHGGFGSHTSAVNRVDQSATYADGSTISADGVSVVSGKDINVTGSNIVGTNSVALAAQGNVNILAATDTWQDSEFHDVKHSGLSGSGGIGFSVGSSEQKDQYDANSVTRSQSRSTVGSVAGNVSISAGKDVHIGGSDIVAGKASGDVTGATGNISIAGQNVTIDPVQESAQSHDQQEARSSGLTVAVTGTPLDAARDLKANASSGSGFQRTQGVLNGIGASAADTPSISVSYGHSQSSTTTDVSSLTNAGSTIRGGGNVSVTATGGAVKDANGQPIDGDLSVIGSTISAGGTTSLAANRNVTLQASTDQLQQSTQSSNSSTGISLASPGLGDLGRWISGTANSGGTSPSPYNASRSGSNGTQAQTTQTATVVSGNSVVVTSNTGDINVVGSGISGTQGVDLVAKQGAINVLAGLDTSTNHQDSSSHQIGSLGSNGTATGFSVGVANSHSVQDAASQTQSTMRSQIVSGDGNVTLDANQDVTVAGADLGAARDLTLIGKNVNLDPGTDATQSSASQSSSQFGVSLALGGAVGNAIATVNQSMNNASHAGDSRLAALDTAQAGLAAYNTYQVASATGPASQPLIKATVSIGGGSSHSNSQSSELANDGSTLHAGGTVSVIATGSGAKDANGLATDGDINARGTQISGQDVVLNAARDINLQSAQDTSQQSGSNSSSGGSIGVGFGLGGQQNGFTIELAASTANGHANGNGVTNRDTQINAADTVTLTSGRDTNLRGAEVAGNTVDANVGRDLNIASQQDTNTYDSRQTSAGFQASICVPPICYGTTVSGTANASDQTIKDNYQSVGAQSGIYAGNGGYNVNVGNHTQLDGGVIASTATPDRNSLSTQTLGYTNLQNTASYSGESMGFGVSGSFGQSTADGVNLDTPVKQAGSSTPGPQNSSGLGPSGFGVSGTGSDASGTTYAAVSPGTITVRGDTGTGQDSTAGLSRDTANANGSVQNTFNAQSVQNDMAIQQMTGQVGMQVVGDVGDRMEKDAIDSAKQAVKDYDDARKRGDTAGMTQAQADYAAASQQYALWGNDGAARIASHAVVAGVGAGMGGGSVAGAVGGTVAGDIAGNAASHATDDTLGGTLLSNVASGLAGAAAGGALGGAAGALGGANGALSADLYNRQLHPQEKTAAQQIAANAAAQGITNPDGSPITVDQIENAMRAANNSEYGEIVATGVVVPLNANTPAGAIYDTTGMTLTKDSAGNSYLVQDPSMLATPSQTVQNLIQQSTGGDNSPYSWGALSSTPSSSDSTSSNFTQGGVYQAVNGQYRQQVTVGGETYDIGLMGTCATAECVANGSNINWTDTGSRQLQQAINTGLVTAISNGAAIVSIGWPTGFAGATAGYVGLSADAVSAKLQNSFAPLATDIVGIPMQAYLHGLGMADGVASRITTIYQQFMGGIFGSSSQGQ